MARALALLLVLAALPVYAASAGAATYPAGFEERTLATGLTGPTGVAWTPDGRMLVIEKAGRLKVVAPGATTATTALDISSRVNSYWDRGLLGIAVDSSFEANRFVYLLYTYDIAPLTPDGSGPMISRLSRFELSPTNGLSNEVVILGNWTGGACPAPSNGVDCIPSEGLSHSIGSVRSAPDGTLYVGSGDASSWSMVDPLAFRTFNEQSMAGKVLRVDRDGRGLPNHPFCPANANLADVCTKVYAKGFRNPYRFKTRPDGSVVLGDVGWETKEEIDFLSPGRNYGWPCYEGTIRTPGYRDRSECAAEYAKEGTASGAAAPVHDYDHERSSAAIIGGPTYQGTAYPAGYRDSIFFGDIAKGFLKRLRLGPDGAVAGVDNFATGWFGTDLETAPNGDLVYANFADGQVNAGSIRRIAYSPGNLTPIAVAAATPSTGAAPLTVQFSSTGSSDPDGDTLSYSWDFGDGTAGTSPDPTHTYTDSGTWTARLTVSDGRGLSSNATVNVTVGGSGPVPSISTPADESTYRDGDTITIRGSATDPDEGALPPSALSWNVIIHHASHTHQVGTFDGVSEASFGALRDHDADSWYEITLRAQDSSGLVGRRTIQIRPETVPLTIDSAPAGAPVTYGGSARTAPFNTSAAIGFNTTISAGPDFTGADLRRYEFDSWSDGGARSHDITVPATPTTLSARYLENKGYNRTASSSSDEAGSHPRYAIDGDPATRWSSAYADDQWWQVDLGAAREVNTVELDWETAYASSYEVLTSLDGVSWTTADQVSLLAPGVHRSSFATRSARYVRVRGLQRATLFGISFWEARVLGPPDPAPPVPTDLALGRPATASSVDDAARQPGAANDGDTFTRWSSNYTDNQWWQVDLGQIQSIDRVEVNWEAAYASAYRIQTSTDGTTFTTAASVTRTGAGLATTTFAARSARYVRLVGDTRGTIWGISFWDFRVFGPGSAPPPPPPPPDTDPPETTITSGPAGTVSATTASLAFASDEGASTFECRLDGGAWAACSSPKEYTSLAPGGHTFEVRAADPAGNVDPTPASRTWTVEQPATGGDLALGKPATASSTDDPSRPAGAANDGNPATRWSSNYTAGQWWQVDLGSQQTIDRVEVNWEVAYASAYRIQTSTDGSSFATAASVTRTAAGLAVTTFPARAARYVRLVGDTRATGWGISFWDFRVFGPGGPPPPPPPDTDPPETTIGAGPSGTVSANSATFEFSSDETGSTFECRLDAGAFTPCTTPQAYSGIAAGPHTFEVRAIDPAGNVDPTPASTSWTVSAATTPSYAETVASTAGLRHWWRLGDSGTSAADSKGGSPGAYVGGPPRVASLIGSDTDGAHDFDGVNDLVDLAPGPFGAPAQFSVEVWVRLDTRKTGNGLHYLVTNAFDDLVDGFSLFVDNANRPQFSVARVGAGRGTAVSSLALTLGTPSHVVGTYDGTRVRVFVNGVERASVAYAGGAGWHVSRDLYLASQRKSLHRSLRWLDGRLDEVALYDRALAADVILSHYDRGR